MARYSVEQANALIAARRLQCEQEQLERDQAKERREAARRRWEIQMTEAGKRLARAGGEAALWKAHAKCSAEIRAIWHSMKSRCIHDPHYNGRIAVCPKWERLDSFWADMGERPSRKHSLGRIDNDKDYTPENCRWELGFQQGGNRRTCKATVSGIQGVNWEQRRGRWVATGMLKGKKEVLYRGEDYELAVAARQVWEQRVRAPALR